MDKLIDKAQVERKRLIENGTEILKIKIEKADAVFTVKGKYGGFYTYKLSELRGDI